MFIRDYCNRNVICCEPDAPIAEVAALMRRHHVGDVVVIGVQQQEQRVPIGIITDRDIVIRAVAYGHDLGSAATDYATGSVFTMNADTSVQDAAKAMADRQLRRLPVTDSDRVVGIVSLADLATRASGGADEQALQGISQPTI